MSHYAKVYCLCVFFAIGIASEARNNVEVEPDARRNISELIASKGYPVEEHEVLTGDGYILALQRIPRGRNAGSLSDGRRGNRTPFSQDDSRNSGRGDGKPVVLLHHGFCSTGADFVLNFPNSSLGFLLADTGYDVWITNARGNRYSKRHQTLSPRDARFWQFSWDEMSLVDLPATIDYILNSTGQGQLYYVGHSMGTTTLFALLSDKPQYNAKIKAAVAMAPVAYLAHTQTKEKFLLPFMKEIQALLSWLDHGELDFSTSLMTWVKEVLCVLDVRLCYNWFFALSGMSIHQFNYTRAPVYVANAPDSTSVQALLHFAQLIKSRKFQKYDYGPEINMKKYNQSAPPEYELERIVAPIALMWGLNDPTADPVDVAALVPKLKNLLLNYRVLYPEWSHLDFVIGVDAASLVYQPLMKVLAHHR